MDEAEKVLAHFGVKGMKWGVRKDPYSTTGIIVTTNPPKVGTMTVDRDGKPAFVLLIRPANSKERAHVHDALPGILDRNGAKAYQITTQNMDQLQAARKAKEDKKAKRNGAGSPVRTAYRVGQRATRFALAQSEEVPMETADVANDILAHYGVKGMKWGIRKNRSQGTPPEHQSEMAQRKHEALAKIKKHGLDAATNDDLKMLEQRVKLETKFNELFPKKKSPLQKALDFGAEEAKKILLPIAEQQAKDYLSKQVTKKLLGPAAPAPKQNSTSKTVDSVLKVIGDHQLADQPKTKLPHFGFA